MPSNGRSDEFVFVDGTACHGVEHLPLAVQGLGSVELVLRQALRAVIEKQPALAGDGLRGVGGLAVGVSEANKLDGRVGAKAEERGASSTGAATRPQKPGSQVSQK